MDQTKEIKNNENRGNTEPEKTQGQEIFSETVLITLKYIQDGLAPKDIAKERDLKESTIYTHLAEIIEAGHLSVEEIISLDRSEIEEIEKALLALPEDQQNALKPIFEKFEGRYEYGILRCIRAGLWRE